MSTGRILWITSPHGISEAQKFALNIQLQKQRLNLSQVYFVELRSWGNDNTVTSQEAMKEKLDGYIEKLKPKIIVCNDPAALQIFTSGTLFLCRGSVYDYIHRKRVGDGQFQQNRYDVLIFDECRNWINMSIKIKGKTRFNPGKWILTNDIQKLARWVRDEQRQQPAFSYTVCRTLHDLQEARKYLTACLLVSPDCETHPDKITVVGYAGLHPDGRLHTYVIPFFNPFRSGKAHWTSEEEELFAWRVVGEINSCAAVKCLQNGQYDSCFKIKFGVPLENYSLDVLHLWHSLYTEAPKKLNFISSIVLDYCRFWKDEAKGDEEDKSAEHKGRFKTPEAYERYLRYNALDCYNTILNCRFLCLVVAKAEWAKNNYKKEFALQMGPALHASMQGLRISRDRIDAKKIELSAKSTKRIAELKIMADDPDFNPFSSQQFGHLLYKTLGAKMPALKGKAGEKQAKKKSLYSVDETILKIVKDQHPLLELYIDRVMEAKKPKNNISKYCDKEYPYGRFYYMLNGAGTETGRFASKKHNFNFGTQIQNVPLRMRDIIIADPGYVFFEPDFSQSDAWFVAYESEDENMIANLNSGKDMHCVHGAFFFGETYEHFLKEYKADNLRYSADPTGLRCITKRIAHGKNYDMGGFTLYMLMGRAAVVAAAQALGYKDAPYWDQKRMANFCQHLLDKYDLMYPRLKPWKQKAMQDGRKAGNTITAAFGRTRLFFGDLTEDKATQREAIAYFGQGGTAGNINRVILEYYYRNRLPQSFLMSQTHDSLLFQFPEDKLHEYANIILTIMREPVTIKGRSFSVPVAAKCGYSWGKGTFKNANGNRSYSPNLRIEDLQADAKALDTSYTEFINQNSTVEIKNAA